MNTERVWLYRFAFDVPLMTPIVNIYGFVGLPQLTFLTKVPFFVLFFNTEGVWLYGYAHDVPLVTLILNMYGLVGLTSTIPA